MKKIIMFAALFCAFAVGTAQAATRHMSKSLECDPSIVGVDAYDLIMVAKVPRIYDNTTSKGYRKYQAQRLKGKMYLIYRNDGSFPEIQINNLENYTHKINGKRVTYTCTIHDSNNVIPLVSVIGHNAKNVFNTGSISFGLDAEPSYNIGEDEPDNSLIVSMSGMSSSVPVWCYQWYGSSYYKYLGYYYQLKTWRGYFAGTLGCGCRAYGHVSPTRVAGAAGNTDQVVDIAAVFGQWRATYSVGESWRACGFECY